MVLNHTTVGQPHGLGHTARCATPIAGCSTARCATGRLRTTAMQPPRSAHEGRPMATRWPRPGAACQSRAHPQRGSWKGLGDVEMAAAEWVHRYNTARPTRRSPCSLPSSTRTPGPARPLPAGGEACHERGSVEQIEAAAEAVDVARLKKQVSEPRQENDLRE